MKAANSLNLEASAKEIVDQFERKTRFHNTNFEIKERSNGDYLILNIVSPSERFFQVISDISDALPESNEFRNRVTIKKRTHPPTDRLSLPETFLLKTVITESLTVSSSTFGTEFLSRYIRSVFGAEDQVIAQSNHLVFGRRGSGKSSLLLYALHNLKAEGVPYVWIAMQTYEGRSDFEAVIDIFIELLQQILTIDTSLTEAEALLDQLTKLDSSPDAELQFDRLVPKIRRSLTPITQQKDRIVVFLDDIHVLDSRLQPLLLSKLYAVSRDNRVFLKISGIEQLTDNWDPSTRKGLATPHDAQIIPLDYNLTMPSKSLAHIKSILDAHAVYSGLPNVGYICGSGVLERLVWVAAGVPRDALSIFLSAISKSALKDQKRVSITSVNEAASVTSDVKLSDINRDASGKIIQIKEAFAVVRDFCISTQKKNAFLVEIKGNDPAFELLQELIALRLLHVLHEGVTPHEAGRRYMALMLDYGFYVGIRAARSVDLFQKEPAQILAKDLRNLPIFQLNLIKTNAVQS
jgi:hypothetical protein